MICPNCGFQFSDDPLLHTLYEIQRDAGVITTVAFASRVNYSERMARYKLNALQQAGVILRYGQRKGWLIKT